MTDGEWRVVRDEGRSAEGHMAYDHALAQEDIPTVRLFLWTPPAVSWGWKQRPPEWLASASWPTSGLEGVERPTGGGIAFHGSDVSVSVVIPRSRNLPLERLMGAVCESAATLCRTYGLQAFVQRDPPTCVPTAPANRSRPLGQAGRIDNSPTGDGFTFGESERRWGDSASRAVPVGLHAHGDGRVTHCLTELSPYAVTVGPKKIAGFALRRYPSTWLIQGSLLVRPLPEPLLDVIPWELRARLHARAVSLSEAATGSVSESTLAARWADHWALWWEALMTHKTAPSTARRPPTPPRLPVDCRL